jgi:hypothetical protein
MEHFVTGLTNLSKMERFWYFPKNALDGSFFQNGHTVLSTHVFKELIRTVGG